MIAKIHDAMANDTRPLALKWRVQSQQLCFKVFLLVGLLDVTIRGICRYVKHFLHSILRKKNITKFYSFLWKTRFWLPGSQETICRFSNGRGRWNTAQISAPLPIFEDGLDSCDDCWIYDGWHVMNPSRVRAGLLHLGCKIEPRNRASKVSKTCPIALKI